VQKLFMVNHKTSAFEPARRPEARDVQDWQPDRPGQRPPRAPFPPVDDSHRQPDTARGESDGQGGEDHIQFPFSDQAAFLGR